MNPPPGSSRRCRECRLRRVKCGLEQPSCDRCLKRGLQCSGPSKGQIFIRRNISNIQDISDRENLSLAIRSEHNNMLPPRGRALAAVCRINKQAKHPSPLSTISSVGISVGLYRSAVADFWSLSCDPVKNSAIQTVEASMSICCQVILPLAFRNKALDAALFTTSTMYLGRARGDASLRKLAMASYPTALSHFRSELTLAFDSKAEERNHKDSVLSILISLLLFEWLAHGPNGEGYRRHIHGALTILKLAGPQSFQPPVARQIYTAIRTVVLCEAYKTREATFLADDNWANIPYQGSAKTHRESLLDITLHVPGFLERSDQIKCLGSTKGENAEDQRQADGLSAKKSQYKQALEYLRDCDSLIQKFYNWLESLEGPEKRPLWWYSRNPAMETKSQQSSLIHFSYPKAAGLLIYYWTGLLQLYTTILEVRDLFRHDALFTSHCEALGADSPSMSMSMDRPSQVALRVCQTAVYLGSTLEGCTMAYVPVELAEIYFNRLLATEWQSDWGDEHDRELYYERARIGLKCSKLRVEKLRRALQNYQ